MVLAFAPVAARPDLGGRITDVGRSCRALKSGGLLRMQSTDDQGSAGRRQMPNRRAILPALLTLVAAASSSSSTSAASAQLEGYKGSDPRILVSRGMERFKEARVQESLQDFDKAMEVEPRYGDVLWQRGLTLYYLDRFDDAAKQFQRDVKLNPSDSEEAIWNFLSLARRPGSDFKSLQTNMLQTLPDSRPYMKAALGVFAGKLPRSELERFSAGGGVGSFPFGGEGGGRAVREAFYAELYLGLLDEAAGDAAAAKLHLVRAAQSEYGSSGDYMWYLARVHCKLRGWEQ